jgi:hypothetical protein
VRGTRVVVVLLALVPALAAQQEPAAAVQRGCTILLELQEGEGQREWPYEGVYREREPGQTLPVIPLGYRVGGTAIACLALIAAPGYGAAENEPRRQAVARGLDFVLEALESPLMAPAREDDYDVRGWGFIYALQLCAELERRGCVPAGREEAVAAAAERLVSALRDTEIARGGWNYAQQRTPAAFMTAPALQALFAAAQAGHDVPAAVVERALDSLERGRAASGSIAYAVPDESRATVAEDALGAMDKLPGAIGRMLACEATLTLGGRGDQGRLAAAVQAFFGHWVQLEVRRKQTGTHTGAYGVAPYYFMYAHRQAALAIELLPDPAERQRQRARLDALLAEVQEDEGGWNNRVFPRSRAYGTAMGMLALLQSEQPEPARWSAHSKSGGSPPATR